MPNYDVREIKAFVPSKDFALSINFYRDIGFDLAWSDNELAYFKADTSSFLLQNYYLKEHADSFMMHLLVNNADDWWARIKRNNVVEKYGVKVGEPEDRDWGLRDFTVIDPTGVLWRIGHVIGKME